MNTNKVCGNVTGQIFTFSELKEKLSREISRLTNAEEKGDRESAIDHALNAAFTGYHLIEWEEKESDSSSKKSARDLLQSNNSLDLDLLHDIVTRTKHVTISNSAISGQEVDVRVSVVGNETIQNLSNTTIEELSNYSMESFFVKFGNKRARLNLERVLSHFS